jgi:hypothetical protein
LSRERNIFTRGRRPKRDVYFKYYRRERQLLLDISGLYINPMIFHRKAVKQMRFLRARILPFLIRRLILPRDRDVLLYIEDEVKTSLNISKRLRSEYGSIFRTGKLD